MRGRAAVPGWKSKNAPQAAVPVPPPPRPQPFALIVDPRPYHDPDPPACDTCWSVRACTRGRVRRCGWCRAETDQTAAPVVAARRTRVSKDG